MKNREGAAGQDAAPPCYLLLARSLLARSRALQSMPPNPLISTPSHCGLLAPSLESTASTWLLRVLGEDQRWEGSASELAGRCGMSPVAISRAIAAPKVTVELASWWPASTQLSPSFGRLLRRHRGRRGSGQQEGGEGGAEDSGSGPEGSIIAPGRVADERRYHGA